MVFALFQRTQKVDDGPLTPSLTEILAQTRSMIPELKLVPYPHIVENDCHALTILRTYDHHGRAKGSAYHREALMSAVMLLHGEPVDGEYQCLIGHYAEGRINESTFYNGLGFTPRLSRPMIHGMMGQREQ
ncbi:hypothetical protein HZB02_05180 [Candidatus Woesearchaeota archaeon]|nr:hypothetical protein [Candidatus Woesearchaeota archaeon]